MAKTYSIRFPRLSGGLNLQELDHRLSADETPEMKNLWWQDGLLQCRDGQAYLLPPQGLGQGFSCTESLFWDRAFFHIGDGIYYTSLENPGFTKLLSGVPENRGTFFRYGDHLYYKNRGGFYRIAYGQEGFSATVMTAVAYTPVILMNADPSTGAGDLYQPENRLSGKKTVRYDPDGSTLYKLPVEKIDAVDAVTADGEEIEYAADLEKGQVAFVEAPTGQVEITFTKENPEALKSIMDCTCAAVYGAGNDLCILLGGCESQPNAVFWNSNDDLSMNPGYWPMAYYNLCGDTEDAVTGFGMQYSRLMVFKGRSVGKLTFSVEDLDGRHAVSFTYETVSSKIGCDLPHTIQLMENNLVFCSSQRGVFRVEDTSFANENSIRHLSRNVDGTGLRPGLLAAVGRAKTVCSFDDGSRYWLCADGQVFLWDYKEKAWFYFTNVPAVAFFRHGSMVCHLDEKGGVTVFRRDFLDYGEAIEKVYRFPPQFFDTYQRLKDVRQIIFTVRSDTDSLVEVEYHTDYERRQDQTPIRVTAWRMAPRNLRSRGLKPANFAHVAIRRPGCRHVRHFAATLRNCAPGQDLSILSAQIFYRFLGRDY